MLINIILKNFAKNHSFSPFLSFGSSTFNFEQMLNADTLDACNKMNAENKLKLFLLMQHGKEATSEM